MGFSVGGETGKKCIESKLLYICRSSEELYSAGCLNDMPAGSPTATHFNLIGLEYGILP